MSLPDDAGRSKDVLDMVYIYYQECLCNPWNWCIDQLVHNSMENIENLKPICVVWSSQSDNY
jgi:hypothetical protein